MTVCLELDLEARRRGLPSVFVPTGQTGIAIAGWGIAVDEVVSDYVAGATEQLVVEGAGRGGPGALLWIEGQGSINHPLYSGVTLGLLHGAAPHVMLLVHEPGRTHLDMPDGPPVPPLPQLIEDYARIASYVRPAPHRRHRAEDQPAGRGCGPRGRRRDRRGDRPAGLRSGALGRRRTARRGAGRDRTVTFRHPWPTPDSTRWRPCCAGTPSRCEPGNLVLVDGPAREADLMAALTRHITGWAAIRWCARGWTASTRCCWSWAPTRSWSTCR